MNARRIVLALGVACLAATNSASSRAQHLDVLVQDLDGRLATGSADFNAGSWTLGRRVYASEFDSDYAVSNPGFNALGSTSPSLPAGAAGLPAGAALAWDFLPLKIDGVLANLFYWNGASPEAVSFGVLPGPNYELSLFGRNADAGVNGGPEFVPGEVIEITAASGGIHSHRFFFLDSGDNNATTTPADGIYLMAMRLRMEGLDRSLATYFVWGTPGSTLPALQAAEAWIEDRVDLLAPDFAADFDGDLDVDGADFLTWQQNLGRTETARLSQGDANGDRAITMTDLAVWRDQYGLNLQNYPGAGAVTAAATAIPEPTTIALATACCLLTICCSRRRSSSRACRP
jgi:hypothetical protein